MRILSLLLLLIPAYVFAQVSRSSELFITLKEKDSLLFQVAFNSCNINQFEELLSDSFEFYHDEAGIKPSKAAFISDVKNNLCKLSYKAIRVLDEKSLEVFPLEKNGKLYGAVQTGTHDFYALEKDKPGRLTSTAKFNHLWLLENGNWKLSRALSYNHKEPETINEGLIFKDRDETEKWLVKNRIPLLGIGYIKDGKIKEAVVYGKNKEGKTMPANTIFNVASLTKPITTMVTLALVNEGKWNLDEPLHTYWTDPDIQYDTRTRMLTTRHVLSHQSGFPNWRKDKLAFEFEPGTKYQYSGEGFEYLRKALEHKFHKQLEQLAKEILFDPLSMKDTRFYWDKDMDESRFAEWHKGDGSTYPTYKNTAANAADDLLTTVEDYCKFMLYMMNGAGLKKELYQEMSSLQVRVKPRKYFGLGWQVDEKVNGEENVLTHGGDDKGVHTIVFILPQSKQGLLIFTNCDNGTDIYIPVVQYYLGKIGQEIIDVETKP